MAEIRLEGITKRFGSFTALDNLSATIGGGAFTAIFGPPGSGKSVLLRVLLGLETVDAGRILIDGRDMTHATPNARNLSMVFQNLALFPHLDARANIAFPLTRRQVPQAEITSRLDRLQQVLGIAHILHKKPGALSGGERQRMAIGRALIRDAAAYMMDEPIAALDARLRDAMRVELKRLQAEQAQTFIYVTHDCDEAMAVADQMIILDKGRIVQADAPDAVYAAPASLAVASLVGSPRINLLEGHRADGLVKHAFGQIPAPAGDGPLTVAIRPEALRLAPNAGEGAAIIVEDIERLGAFSILTVTRGDHRLRVIADGMPPHAIGDLVCVSIDPAGVHLFDPQTGQRIA